MINAYTVVFVGVAAITGLAADYVNQSQVSGRSLGSVGAQEYFASIKTRIDGQKQHMALAAAEQERKSRWKAAGQVHLPEAPAGWERRALLDGDQTAIFPSLEPAPGTTPSVLDTARANKEMKDRKQRAKHAWVYQRGSETVFLELDRREATSLDTITGMAGAMIGAMNAFDTSRGYAVVGGVSFVEKVNTDGRPRHHFRELEGVIGFNEEVHIRVHANASYAATRELLEAIDYDGLNALVQTPAAHVGNDIKLAANLDERTIAQRVNDLRNEFIQLRAMEAEYRIAEIDPLAQALKMTPQTAWLFDANLMAANQKADEVDLSTLIEIGYRHAAFATLQGKNAAEVAQGFAQLIRDFGIAAEVDGPADDTPVATMSPELAAELGFAPAKPAAATKPIQPIKLSTTREHKPLGANSDVGRLQLSGGTTCLNGGGRLCD